MLNKTNKKGFTLIELLVVVLIIAVLAAIAVPQYRQIVFNAKMKNIEIAVRNVDEAYKEYQLVNGKGALPTVNVAQKKTSLTWGAPGNCTLTSSNWWVVVWNCLPDSTVGISKDPLGVATAYIRLNGGFGGHYDRLEDGTFRCRGFADEGSEANLKNFKKYCEINHIPYERTLGT
jgi:prepilin-type N-terminal cleavage/methylation domain-containing protein